MKFGFWNILVTLVIVITLPLYCSQTGRCFNRGDVRLQNGTNKFEGQVEVCGTIGETLIWKTVCNAGWDVNEAMVVCRQLGFSNINPISIADGTFGNHNARHIDYTVKKNFTCRGDERALLNCTYYNRNSSYCYSNESQLKPAGVYCFGHEQKCYRNADIRLSNGTNSNTGGRVEVCLDGLWGTVCDNGWDSNDATTVCRQLGYNHKRAIPTRGAYFGEGSGPIHLSRAECRINDMRLTDCTIDKTGINGCRHSEDAGVICIGDSNCDDFDIRLVGGENEREGQVEICYNGVWGTVCDYGWDQLDANVVCQQLGFGYQGTISIRNSHFGTPVLLENIECNQNHSNLSQCVDLRLLGSYHDCEYTTGVICTDEDLLMTNISTKLPTTYTDSALLGTVGALFIVTVVAVIEMVLIAILLQRRKKAKCNHTQVKKNTAAYTHYTINASKNGFRMEENTAYDQVPCTSTDMSKNEAYGVLSTIGDYEDI